MTTKQYIQQFRLFKENPKFNKEEFLKVFAQEFLDRLEITKAACEKMGAPFNFHKFQLLIREHQSKFQGISNKIPGGLTEGLWNAFYAIHIIPIRAEVFPEEHARINANREKAKERAEKDEAKKMEKEKAQEEYYDEMDCDMR